MKTLSVILSLFCLFFWVNQSDGQSLSAASELELGISGGWYFPDDGDSFENAFGGELALREWMSHNVGLAFAVGGMYWDVKEVTVGSTSKRKAIDLGVNGSMTAIPLGPSLLVSPDIRMPVHLVLEVGGRYVIVNSSAEVAESHIDLVNQGDVLYRNVDFDDCWIGVVNLQVEGEFNQSVNWMIGAGYQFDIVESDVVIQGLDVADLSMEAFSARCGLIVKY